MPGVRAALHGVVAGLLTVALVVCADRAGAAEERIKDLADIAGVRSNQLIGYGLVIGLDGTGDQTTQAPFTAQSLRNMLSQLGVTILDEAEFLRLTGGEG